MSEGSPHRRYGAQRLRRHFSQALLAIFFALAPSSVPAWRADPRRQVAAVLMVGDPVVFLPWRVHERPVVNPDATT